MVVTKYLIVGTRAEILPIIPLQGKASAFHLPPPQTSWFSTRVFFFSFKAIKTLDLLLKVLKSGSRIFYRRFSTVATLQGWQADEMTARSSVWSKESFQVEKENLYFMHLEEDLKLNALTWLTFTKNMTFSRFWARI